MASFMSGLLLESFGTSEVPFGQIQIDIVDDNAKVEIEQIGEIHRTRSLVTMRRQRSGRQLSRWACSYERQDSDPNLMTRATRRAPRGTSKLLTTTSDSMLLNLPARTTSPKLPTSGKTLMSSTIGSKGRLGNATWTNADVEKSSHRGERSQIFDLSLDMSPAEQQSKLDPNPFLMDRLSSISLIDERNCGIPMTQKLDVGSPLPRCDSMDSLGIRKPVRRPSVQPTNNTVYHEDNDATPYQQHNSQYGDVISVDAMDTLNSITLVGSSSSSLNNMTRIRDPSALGIQMPNRKTRNSSDGSQLLPDNQQSSKQRKQKQQKSSKSQSASNTSSGMRRVSSSSKGLERASVDDASRRSSSYKSLNSKKILKDPSLVGLKVKMGK